MMNRKNGPVDWAAHLEENETIRWEGRPAPRCFVFKRWKDTIFGFVVLALSCYWLKQGIQLTVAEDYPFWLALLPIPVIIGGLKMSIGKLVRTRLRWEQVFYVITDTRIVVYDNEKVSCLPLKDITYFKLDYHGEQLGSLSIYAGSEQRKLILECIEYPNAATDLLEPMIRSNEAGETQAQSASESC